jgi:HlyD family secretion protein
MQKARPWVTKGLRIGALFVVTVVLIGLGYYGAASGLLSAVPGIGQAQSATSQAGSQTTVPTLTAVRSASDAVGTVTAAGNLELVSQSQAVLQVGGVVKTAAVEVGDQVKAGDVLVELDGADLERAVSEALLDLAGAQNALDDLLEAVDPDEIAVAQANLLAAQEELADVQAGPSDQEIAAARSKVAAAAATVSDLQAGPSDAELTQLAADLRKSEVAVASAQSAYDQVAWRTDAGMTSEAAELQSATIDYEAAKAAYADAGAVASEADLQSAYSSVQSAQEELDALLKEPTAASIATAQAAVVEAQATLDDLLAGADAKELEDARLELARAQLSVESAAADLAASQLRAQADGTVLEVNVDAGEQATEGTVAVVLADVNQLELTVNVAEVDIDKVTVGMPAEITIDALTGKTFTGEVTRIAPSTDPDSSVVNYPVTVRLTDDNVSGARAGMTAVASLSAQDAASGWLVPANAIQTEGNTSVVMVMRDGAPTPVTVRVGTTEGEWVVVQSADLAAGDQVVGSVTSAIDPDASPFGVSGGAMPMGGPPAGGGVIIRP